VENISSLIVLYYTQFYLAI